MPCGYCGVPGHSVDVCPERLEDYHGLPNDHEDGEEQGEEAAATDGGTIERNIPSMSTQSDLTDFQTALEIRENSSEDESGQDEQQHEKPNWQPRADNEPDCGTRVMCECGNDVSADFARVFGNNDDELVNGCPSCSTYREISGRENSYGDGVGRRDPWTGGGSL